MHALASNQTVKISGAVVYALIITNMAISRVITLANAAAPRHVNKHAS